MEKRIFLFKVLVILLLIYFIIAVGAFFKSYKQASAENYNLTPTTILYFNRGRESCIAQTNSRLLEKFILWARNDTAKCQRFSGNIKKEGLSPPFFIVRF